MKHLLFVAVLFFLVPIHVFSSEITFTSTMLDNRSWDQRYFNFSDESSIVSWAMVQYSDEDTNTSAPPTVNGYDMKYDGKWSDTEEGFYKFFDLSDSLSAYEKNYVFSLEGIPGSEKSMTIAPNTFDSNFGIPVTNINNGLVTWVHVPEATQYRIRLHSPDESGNWLGEMVFQVKLDSSVTSYQLDEEWMQNDFVLRMEARKYDDGKIYQRSSYFTHIEAAFSDTLCDEGCTQSDLDAQYQSGYSAGYAACQDSTGNAGSYDDGYSAGYEAGLSAAGGSGTLPTVNTDLSINMPSANYFTLIGTMNIWANFTYEGTNSSGKHIWSLDGYGQN